MPYEIQFRTSAAKEFRKLGTDVKARPRRTINALTIELRPPGVKKLTGASSLYRVRTGNYRIIYEVDDNDQLIVVTRVRHRRDIYQ